MTAQILVRGRNPPTVFDVWGRSENTATYALARVLSRSDSLMNVLLEDLGIDASDAIQISCQKSGDDRGYTDLEIVVGADAHIVIEAKLGWRLPDDTQLRRYLPRLHASGCKKRMFVTVSAVGVDYAKRGTTELDGIPVIHRSWSDLHRLTSTARENTRAVEERLWLAQLIGLLSEYRQMQQTTSNLAYVVVLSPEPTGDGDYSFIDVVEKDRSYYHPAGVDGWPTIAPNYMAFRYGGELRSVHHVESSQLVRSPSDVDARWSVADRDHLVYRLGPPMVPSQRLPNGGIYATGRLYAAIDLLLSGAAASIHEAVKMTTLRTTEILN